MAFIHDETKVPGRFCAEEGHNVAYVFKASSGCCGKQRLEGQRPRRAKEKAGGGVCLSKTGKSANPTQGIICLNWWVELQERHKML